MILSLSRTKTPIISRAFVLKLTAALLLWIVLMIAWSGGKAHAIMTLSPDPGSSIPSNIRDYLRTCDQNVPLRSPAFAQWISSTTNRAQTSFSVPYGTTSINLLYDLSAAVCASNSAVTDTRYQVTSASVGVSGIVGDVLPLNFNPYNQKGLYRETWVDFNYAPAGGFTTSGNHVITIGAKGVNRFASGKYLCIGGAGTPTSSLTNTGPCTETFATFTIYVEVASPPRYNIDIANCNVIAGWIFDYDHSNGNIYNQNGTFNNSTGSMLLHLYKNGAYQGQYVSDDYSGDRAYNPPDPRADVNGTFKIDGRHRFSVELAGMNAGTNRFTLYMLGINNDGTVNNNNPAILDLLIGPCITKPAVACGQVQTTPAMPEPGEPFTVQVNFTTSGGSGPDTAYTVSLEVPGYFVNTVIGTGTVARNGGNVTASSSPLTITINNPGAYSGTFTVAVVDGSPNPLSCPFGGGQPRPPIIIASRPYARYYLGDVLTGAGFDSSGCSTSSARFIGFNKGSAGGGAGAGSSLAAFATDENIEFVSAALRTSAPMPLKGLTFANTSYAYGGGFSASYYGCVPDYYAQGIAGGAAPKASGYDVNADVNDVPAGVKYDIYVDGDAFITGNITYATSGGFGSDPAQIPSFRLVAKGNIYIAPGVGEISGVLIAQPLADGTKGRVYTCAQSAWSGNAPANVPNAPQQIGSCNTKLTIYGAVIAKQLKLLRVVGTLRNAVASESYTAANQAESIIFSPEIWLRNPGTGSSSGQSPYNSISGLPPIL